MEIEGKDFYLLFSSQKFKKITQIIQDGYSGMYYVLKILNEYNGKVCAGDISKIFKVTTARTAGVLKTLEKKGYIVREKGEDDARKTIAIITKKGSEALERRKKEINMAIDEFLKKLDEDEVSKFYEILKKILN